MPKSTRSNTSSTIQRGLSNIDRMQEETDKYTQRYQWQKRNLITVEGVFSNIQKQLNKTNTSVAKLKKQCQEGQMKLIFTKMRNLQKQIDIYDKRFNQTLGQLQKLKFQIDQLREQRLLKIGNIKNLQQDINGEEIQRQKIYTQIQNDLNVSKTSQNIMLNLKIKHQNQKAEYYQQLAQLNSQLRDQKFRSGSKDDATLYNAVQNDTATILKHRLTKLIINNKERVKLIDSYQRNMKIIDQAFNTIKQATGLTDIQQIQNTFIKSQQQNYGLLTYVDLLNQQIDALKDSNQSLKQKNTALKIDNAQKHRILNGTPDDQKQRRKIQQLIKTKQQDITKFDKLLQYLQPKLQDSLMALAKSSLNKDPSKLAQYQTNGISINDTSLDQYLAQLEKYTNWIIVYRAKKNKESNGQILAKTLLLEEIPNKDFTKRKVLDNNQLFSNLGGEDGQYAKQLLDKSKLDQYANKQIEKIKNTVAQKGKKK